MKLHKRRRIEYITDYKKRIGLLKSNSPRLVIRKSNKYITIELVKSDDAKDKVIAFASSKELLKKGWPKEKQGSLKSVPAAYLTGLLFAKKAKDIKGRLVLDMGLIPNTRGSKIYAAAQGAKDGGMEINIGENALSDKERIEGKHNKCEDAFKKTLKEIK